MTTHDESCELNRPDWPQFKAWTDPITGVERPAGPYPCHCPARAAGFRKAERDLARPANACLSCGLPFRTPANLTAHLVLLHSSPAA
jgi:hypothetical protein